MVWCGGVGCTALEGLFGVRLRWNDKCDFEL